MYEEMFKEKKMYKEAKELTELTREKKITKEVRVKTVDSKEEWWIKYASTVNI